MPATYPSAKRQSRLRLPPRSRYRVTKLVSVNPILDQPRLKSSKGVLLATSVTTWLRSHSKPSPRTQVGHFCSAPALACHQDERQGCQQKYLREEELTDDVQPHEHEGRHHEGECVLDRFRSPLIGIGSLGRTNPRGRRRLAQLRCQVFGPHGCGGIQIAIHSTAGGDSHPSRLIHRGLPESQDSRRGPVNMGPDSRGAGPRPGRRNAIACDDPPLLEATRPAQAATEDARFSRVTPLMFWSRETRLLRADGAQCLGRNARDDTASASWPNGAQTTAAAHFERSARAREVCRPAGGCAASNLNATCGSVTCSKSCDITTPSNVVSPNGYASGAPRTTGTPERAARRSGCCIKSMPKGLAPVPASSQRRSPARIRRQSTRLPRRVQRAGRTLPFARSRQAERS